MSAPERAESWAALGAAQLLGETLGGGDGSDPRRDPGNGVRHLRPRPPADELGDVSEIRLVADHDTGGLYVLVFGSSRSIPMLSWPVPRQFVDELLVHETHAIVRCRAGHRRPQLVTPPGELPTFFAPRVVPG